MIDYILASPVAEESSEAIAYAITRKQGRLCQAVQYARQRRVCVRYGSMVPSDDVGCLNSLDGVKRAANKLGALITLDEAGVCVPRLPLYDTGPYGYPVLLRKLSRHGGNDEPPIYSARSTVVLGEYDYALEYIEKLAEYRVHVCRGEVIRTQVKKRKRDVDNHPFIWSLANGWVLVDAPPPLTYLTWLATKAVAVLGLDFGAVDIVQGQWGLYVLEVNTAPGIIPHGVDKYASAFLKWSKGVGV